MASIGGYRSPVDLGLGRVPGINDPAAFEELTGVYNAIHLLNEYLDSLRNEALSGGSGQTPAESLIFNRFFVAKALVPIAAGSPVAPSPLAGQNGVAPGALAQSYVTGSPVSNFCGIALTSAAAGEDLRVGVGPAVLELAGVAAGSLIYAYSNVATNGALFQDSGIYVGNPGGKANVNGTAYPMPVAVAIATGYILFGQHIVA